QHEVIARVGVVAAEPVAPVVAAAAVLTLPGDGLELAGVGLEAEVAAADVHAPHPLPLSPWGRGEPGRRGARESLHALDDAAGVAVGAVDPVVEAPRQTVDAMLLIAFDEAGEEDDLLVGFAVAVGVFGVENVRGAGNEHALAPRKDAGWIAEI